MNTWKTHVIHRDPDGMIGLNDIHQEGDFKWADGLTDYNFNNFGGEEPNNFHGEDCTAMWKNAPIWSRQVDGEWYDRDCDGFKQVFFCNDYEHCLSDGDDCTNVAVAEGDGFGHVMLVGINILVVQ